MMNPDDLTTQSNLSYQDNKVKGFWEHPGEDEAMYKLAKIALIHSELSEMVEGIRKPSPDQHLTQYPAEWVEAADVLERLFDYSGGFGIPLGEVWAAKKEYNLSRPWKHGKQA